MSNPIGATISYYESEDGLRCSFVIKVDGGYILLCQNNLKENMHGKVFTMKTLKQVEDLAEDFVTRGYVFTGE
jgi:hypothetical protein